MAQEVTITDSQIVEQNNEVTVRFIAKIGKVKSDEKLIVTPVLYTDLHTKELAPIIIMGRNKAISESRTGNMKTKKSRGKQIVSYTITIPYEEWMGEVSLRIESLSESCCATVSLPNHYIARNQLIHYDLQAVYSSVKIEVEPTELEKYDREAPFLYSMTDYDKRYETIQTQREKGALKIYFKQGSSLIDSHFSNNAQILEQVNNVISLIQSTPAAKLRKIVILGLTSPEGTLSHNTKLAIKRAESLKNYLASRVTDVDKTVTIIPADEDWDGLVNLVKASDMQYREEVLEIIEQYPVKQGREKHLMDLREGRPYRYMLEHFFPQLRNAGYIQIYYDFEPDTTIVKLNSAIELINDKQYAESLAILGTLKTHMRVDNLMGVALMMMGRYAEAELHLSRAAEGGNKEAAQNLEQIKKKQRIGNSIITYY